MPNWVAHETMENWTVKGVIADRRCALCIHAHKYRERHRFGCCNCFHCLLALGCKAPAAYVHVCTEVVPWWDEIESAAEGIFQDHQAGCRLAPADVQTLRSFRR